MSARFTRRSLVSVALAALLGGSLLVAGRPACAGPLAQVDVYDVTAGRSLPVYPHRGRSYVAGEPGHEYAVRIRNCSGRRVLAVVSVDGVNAVTGETAAPSQSGYVIEPGGYVNVEGWRKSLDSTAAFYFTDPSDAYATRTGRPGDLGVIGVAIFPERVLPPAVQSSAELAKSSGAAREADSAARPQAAAPPLGTGHGRRVDSPAQYVDFERASDTPEQVVRIRYDRAERLAALGIRLNPAVAWRSREPDPFPAARGFVPDP